MVPRNEMSRRYTRRAFLGSLAVGVTGLLAACGGGSKSNTPTVSSSSVSGVATVSPSSSSPIGKRYTNEAMLADASLLRKSMAGVSIVALTPKQDYDKGHITGAMRLDWPDIELTDSSTDAALQKWQQQIERKLGSVGLTPANHVVAYDGGTLFAARLWWVLAYLGHSEKQVLNGGLPAWDNDGGQVTTSSTTGSATTYSGTAQSSVLAALPEVESSLNKPNVLFIDARSPGEYAVGHLPGAVNLQYTENAIAGTPPFLKPQDDLRQMYEKIGVTADKLLIPYCSSGVRSAVTYFTLRLIGYQNVKLFSGSWNEWASHSNLPIQK